MNWLRDNGFTIGTHNSYEKGYYFSIERSTPKSIFKNVLSLLQEYSKSKNIDLGWVDVDNDDLNYKWIDDKIKYWDFIEYVNIRLTTIFYLYVLMVTLNIYRNSIRS